MIFSERFSISPVLNISPFTPSSIKSEPHPTSSDTIAGVSKEKLSLTTSPHVSFDDEERIKTSDTLYMLGSSVWFLKPKKWTLFSLFILQYS